MKLLKNLLFFIYSLALHVELMFVFSLNFYLLYFINLFIVMYLLNFKFSDFSSELFWLYSYTILLLINQDLYDENTFDFYLWLDIVDKVPFISSEVMYSLIIVHLLLFTNLKKFENVWDIIDKKLFRI
ncbi:hypothetical protein HUE87_02155 [Candidatus Sulfurimonas marisnigri]|uniref:Uncharacterized protein n=1 Tax=Candidatus Sulfurimonas marisnigri TaxID=2740405 RepID=A0A7S7M0Y9_9BACT|nr:hypothetical protein [Candidatus Sulfurimonas marisnigri]QOY55066.1 hypothetical protein HUE87_02155 [Candidatus Sulfurimonas marisnigri]